MNVGDFDSLSDAEIVACFRSASLERAKCGFNAAKGNRIVDRKMTPAYDALKARGVTAVRALLALTEDPNPNVRADAASYGYDADPTRCRDVLKRLVGEPGLPGAVAVVWLVNKDLDFRTEFEEMGRLGANHFLQELDRRYPPKRNS